jgi:hypothetical protein
MKLLTKELQKKIPPLYTAEKQKDPLVVAKFFLPWTNWTWYVLEYDPEERIFFGYVVGLDSELGYFSLDELESLRGPLGMRVERDLYWKPAPLSKVKAKEVI